MTSSSSNNNNSTQQTRRRFPFARMRLGRGKRMDIADEDSKDDRRPLDDDDTTTTATTSDPDENTESAPPSLDENHHFNEKDLYKLNLYHLVRSIMLSSESCSKDDLLTYKSEIVDAMSQDYTEVLLEHQDDDFSDVQAHLAAATHLWNELVHLEPLLNRSTITTTSVKLQVLELVFSALEDYIHPRMVDSFCSEPMIHDVTPADAAKMIAWMDWFLTSASALSRTTRIRPSRRWHYDLDRVLHVYLDRAVHTEIRHCLLRSVQGRVEAKDDRFFRLDLEGNMVSGMPEEFLFFLDTQLSVSQEILPSKYQEYVLATAYRVVLEMVSELQLQVQTRWRDRSAAWYCATINDSRRLADQLELRIEQHLPKTDLLVSMDHQEDCDAAVRELRDSSLLAVTFLSQHIVATLRSSDPKDNVLGSVGSAAWERLGHTHGTTQTAVARTIATLEDYFQDITHWIKQTDYYLPLVLKQCLDSTLQLYVESFFANTLSQGLKNPSKAASQLLHDHQQLLEFFTGINSDKDRSCFARYCGTDGYYNQACIETKLSILPAIAKLIDPNEPHDEVEQEVRFLLSALNDTPEGADAAVLHLVGLRKRHTTLEVVEWFYVLARVKRLMAVLQQLNMDTTKDEKGSISVNTDPLSSFSSFNSSNSAIKYQLPDLRNSRYLFNVRAPQDELHRRISKKSFAPSKNTAVLISSVPRRPRKATSNAKRTSSE